MGHVDNSTGSIAWYNFKFIAILPGLDGMLQRSLDVSVLQTECNSVG